MLVAGDIEHAATVTDMARSAVMTATVGHRRSARSVGPGSAESLIAKPPHERERTSTLFDDHWRTVASVPELR